MLTTVEVRKKAWERREKRRIGNWKKNVTVLRKKGEKEQNKKGKIEGGEKGNNEIRRSSTEMKMQKTKKTEQRA